MSLRRSDSWLVGVLRGLAAISGTVLVLILAYLLIESWPALRDPGLGRFLGDETWNPSGENGGSFGLLPMIVGSLAITIGAILLAGPVGVSAAAFSSFYAPARLRGPFRRIVELSAGIPSVVYGFWGLVVLAPLVRELSPPGTSLLTGILVLALMIVPTVALVTDAAFRAVPSSYLEGAAALSLSKGSTLRGVVLPATRSGIGIALMLGTTRAIGETMAVLMVCGNVPRVPHSLFDPVRTLTSNIALELGYATAAHRSVLFVSGLVLTVMVFVLVLVANRVQSGATARA